MIKTCVVIPIHSPSPTIDEIVAFKRCFEILSRHDIYILTYPGLNLSAYNTVVKDFKIKYISKNYLSSLMNYNKMKIDLNFYYLFSDYHYLLTYELDAYVFNDDLDLWVNKNIDYIGAPFVKINKTEIELVSVGNSGFSLRNVAKCINCLEKIKTIRQISNLVNKFKLKYVIKIIAFFEKYFKNKFFIKARLISAYTNGLSIHEDIFWSKYIPILFPEFLVCEKTLALAFSFERFPSKLYILNNNILPFGCHAWSKYEPEFWKKHIKI